MNTIPFSSPFPPFSTDTLKDFFPSSDMFGALTRGAMEASTASTRASVKGLQEASQTVMSHMKTQMTLSVETGQKLSEAGSLEDALTIQTGYIKTLFENNLRHFSDMSEVYTETLRESFAPIAKQAKKAAKSTKTAA